MGQEFSRRKAKDGKWYTRTEFIKYYGVKGDDYWRDAPKMNIIEYRPANDGKWYNEAQFEQHYGSRGREMWRQAGNKCEKRIAKDGRAYTYGEFMAYYGNANEWNMASRPSTYQVHGHGTFDHGSFGGPEKREAPDGKRYTRGEFIDFFGAAKGLEHWNNAAPHKQFSTMTITEKRLAPDGKRYTRGEFIDFFGTSKGIEHWDNAAPKNERRVAPDGKRYTRGEFIDFFGTAKGIEHWNNAG